ATHCVLFFFFQAEDGIRDFHVTGVQTCALPISVRGGVELQLGGVGRVDAQVEEDIIGAVEYGALPRRLEAEQLPCRAVVCRSIQAGAQIGAAWRVRAVADELPGAVVPDILLPWPRILDERRDAMMLVRARGLRPGRPAVGRVPHPSRDATGIDDVGIAAIDAERAGPATDSNWTPWSPFQH